jgi:hypothetical protein
VETDLESLNQMLEAFEEWLQINVPDGLYSPQGQLVRPLADPVLSEGATIRDKIESNNLTSEQASALVDPFSLTVARTKLQILRVLGRSPEDIVARSESGGSGVGTFVAFGLAAVVLLYFARK